MMFETEESYIRDETSTYVTGSSVLFHDKSTREKQWSD